MMAAKKELPIHWYTPEEIAWIHRKVRPDNEKWRVLKEKDVETRKLRNSRDPFERQWQIVADVLWGGMVTWREAYRRNKAWKDASKEIFGPLAERDVRSRRRRKGI
jgi:hypothetical protein